MSTDAIVALVERQVWRIDVVYDLMPLRGPTSGDRKLDLEAAERDLPLVKQEILAAEAVARHLPALGMRSQCLRMAVDSLLSRLRLTEEACRDEGCGMGSNRRKAAHGDCILQHPEICEKVLAALGGGYWGFVAPTSRMLRAVYMRFTADGECLFTTSARAALHTPAAFRFALDNGMALSDERVQRAVGATGSVEMVDIAAAANMPLAFPVFLGASRTCKVGLLHHLRVCSAVEFHMRHLVSMCFEAAEGGDKGPALVWLSQQFRPLGKWPAWLSEALCHLAIAGGRIDTLEWLFADGAELFGPLVEADPDVHEEADMFIDDFTFPRSLGASR
ncbi:hypothetical protein JKP88DRAFT_279498 [Tribonema minus]|uniref:Uncharacterized protein n=1 Tax=Tribonema minus TaxID=303371 RepID=A0A836CCJ9_9STRA|nr:hypothetical protein JKP88DRAFT_279498 [Tribonema minus]